MSSTFSESWFQVAPLKLGLLPTVKVHKQLYRGVVWYVLQDTCSGKFFRVRESAYQFLSHLTPNQTVEQLWLEFVENYPEKAPGQEEVIQLLSQLHHGNLLFYRSESDTKAILDRNQKQKRKEHLSKLMAFMYLRVPLWNPNDFLNASKKILAPFFGLAAFLIWLLVILWGGKTAIDEWDQLSVQTQGMLAPSNLFLLYVSLFVLKLFHEMGHAIVIKRFGGEVHTMGIMFIVFTPLPYVDATASWSMRNRWQRVFVGAAGMYVELFFAAIAAVVWANTAQGTLNSLAFNLMIIGSLSSILFNGNPLLRFDAYYILSDLIDLPNLYQKASSQWLYFFNKYLLGTVKAESPAQNLNELLWYSSYGFLSYFYRLLIMIIITIYVADLWIGLGLAMLILAAMIWIVIPVGKLLKYLTTSQELYKNRSRAWLVTSALFVGVITAALSVPLPYFIKAQGVVQSKSSQAIYSESGGVLQKIHVDSGEKVEPGTMLLTFVNPEIEQQLRLIEHQITETQWMQRQAMDQSIVDNQALENRMEALLQQRKEFLRKKQNLNVYANQSGVWVSDNLKPKLMATLPVGSYLGQVVNKEDLTFIAAVTQDQASDLFENTVSKGQLRLVGQSEITINQLDIELNPYSKTLLPSAALSWEGGGSIMAKQTSEGQMQALEPFFEVTVALSETDQIFLEEGMTGYLKIDLAWQPLFWQLQQAFLKILQQRYQI